MPTSTPSYKISEKKRKEYRGQLLGWYDRHKRVLPWRYVLGETPDPYKIWLSEVMLQQTTVTAVKPYFKKFVALWPTVDALAGAEREDIMKEWAGLGYYSRARNLHRCAQIIVNECEGLFPQDQKQLKSLPGIGDYTSAALMTIAFNKPAVVVDGNVERVMSRLNAVKEPLPKSKSILKNIASQWFKDFHERPGDLAQALMDLGATVCAPKSPKCTICPLKEGCKAKKKGMEAEYPYREKKKIRPQKIGYVYWITNEKGQILLHKRPDKGLLPGMMALPTSQWKKREEKINDLQWLDVHNLNQYVNHTFTHFDLKLTLKKGSISHNYEPKSNYIWKNKGDLAKIGFPSLFKKAISIFSS